jgi:DNA-binding NtrC family response regulator
MCDVLLIGDVQTLQTWFDGWIGDATNAWMQVETVGDALSICNQVKPKIILVGDHSLKKDLQLLIKQATPLSRVVIVGHFFDAKYFQLVLDWGANDFWVIPIGVDQLNQKLRRSRLAIEARKPELAVHSQKEDEMVIGTSQDMVTALRMASLVAKTDTTVLIRGESGTGKELLAREIHRLSGRSGPFIALNCAAVSEGVAESELFGHERGSFTGAVSQRLGCFEQAHGGTLFLDEVGDAPMTFQAKLLRVLERNEFTRVGGQQLICADVRIIAATNGDIETLIEAGDFRLDLHYRLGAVTVFLPPLKDRREDLPEIIGKMVGKLNEKLHKSIKGVSKQAVEQLLAYEWPGNLRELYQVLHRAVLLCRQGVIEAEHLYGIGEGRQQENLVHIQTLSEIEEAHIVHVLDIVEGNRGRACDLLGISRPTLRRKLRQYALEVDTVQA